MGIENQNFSNNEKNERSNPSDARMEASQNFQNDLNFYYPDSNQSNNANGQRELDQMLNADLQSQGLLPEFAISDDKTSENASAADKTNDGEGKQPDAPTDKQEWTIAIDLTTSLADGKYGAQQKQEQLRDLAEQTKGTDVTLDVQYLLPDSNEKNAGGTLKHFQIKDGQIIEQEDTRSKGIAQDIEDLLKKASQEDPSNKIGLILQSHGTTQDGIKDENGNTANLDQINQAISNGLEGSGHEKLDMLDLDSCLTASTATLNELKNSTDNLVASSQTESAGPNSDGQNLNAALSNLLEDPSLTGSELAEEFVNEAKEGSNGNGTATLAHFDMSKVDELDSSLDNLGNTLAELAKDPQNNAVLKKDIEEAARYAPGSDTDETSGLENRDLKQVLANISESLESGELKDQTGQLQKSLERAIKAEDDVSVSNYTGESKNPTSKLDPEKTGDLSIFAPSEKFNDTEGTGERANPLNQLNKLLSEDTLSHIDSMEDVEQFKSMVVQTYEQILAADIDSASKDAVKNALEQDINSLKSAATVDQYKDAARKLNTERQTLLASDAEQSYIDLATRTAQEKKEKSYKNAQDQEAPGWNKFLDALYA